MLQSFLEGQGDTGIVDVLAGETEVYEFLVCLKVAYLVKLFFDKVFYCLDIVVGHFFDVFDALSISLSEILIYRTQYFPTGRESFQLR